MAPALKELGFGGRSRKTILELLIGNEEGTSFTVRLWDTWGVRARVATEGHRETGSWGKSRPGNRLAALVQLSSP